jgi:hypothetical protein
LMVSSFTSSMLVFDRDILSKSTHLTRKNIKAALARYLFHQNDPTQTRHSPVFSIKQACQSLAVS